MYQDKLEGFWLGQCIANWTGLITEMDKIGGDGINGFGAGFYTRENWGGADEPNIWQAASGETPDRTIDFVLVGPDSVWGADDDTDIEYIYQFITHENQTTVLTPQQIRDGWMKHIYTDEDSPHRSGDNPENFLWVSNQQAFDLMHEGIEPPATGSPDNNPFYDMIDAQLTTEIFGLYAPGRPDFALKMARLPIQNTARDNAQWIAEFHVIMYSLASVTDTTTSMKDQTQWLASMARRHLPDTSYAAHMYDFVKSAYDAGYPWEVTRDSLHIKYQENAEAGYPWYTKDEACNGCFAAGINFAAGLVSWFYGEGDIRETIKIGSLAGWDSDNPTATWGGLLGFMIGKEGVEKAFGMAMSQHFNIHRTRRGFPNDGMDSFPHMAQVGIEITDRVVQEELGGGVDLASNTWHIPLADQ